MPNLKALCSVSQMAEILDLSRAQFYNLMKEGVFPYPIYSLKNRRPFYDLKLQQICIEIRETGISYSGDYILFYSKKNNQNDNSKNSSTSKESNKSENNSQYKELIATLNMMGLEVNNIQVQEAAQALYPNGIDTEDQGVVIRDIFRFLKKR